MSERKISCSLFAQGMKILWELSSDSKKQIVSILVWAVGLQFLQMTIPLIAKLLVDEIQVVITAGSIGNYFILLAVSMLLINIFYNWLEKFSLEKRFQIFWLAMENSLPVRLFNKLLSLQMDFHDREGMGQKVIAVGKGCDSVTGIISQLHWGLLPSILYLISSIIFYFFMDWRLALVFTLPFPLAIYVGGVGLYKSNMAWRKWDELREVAGGQFIQAVSSVRTVKSFVREQDELKKMSGLREEMRKLDLDVSLMNMRYQFWMDVILKSCFVATIITAVYLAVIGQATIGTVIFIATTGSAASQTIWRIVHDYVEISKRMVAVVRVKEILDENPSIIDDPTAENLGEFKEDIVVDNLSFTYLGKESPTINGLSLRIPKGKMIALVGSSGAGKTTIFSLLQRLYEAASGCISVDGVDIKNLTLASWRRLFAPVSQSVDIFSGTVKENILYACPKASDGKIIEALMAANLGYILDNADRFPEGINTIVGERGVKLSGGERQRLGIARAYAALSNGAKILLLDEATSNLDSEAEAAIQKVIKKLRQERGITVVVIAHRLSTIQMADEICVLENGKIVEQGDHAKLMKRNGLYSRLAGLQNLGIIRED